MDGRRKRQASPRIWLLGAAVVAVIAIPTSANANPFGYTSGVRYWADNGNHTYFNNGLATQSSSAMDYAMGTRLESTDMTTDKFESWNQDTDVVVWDDYYGNTTWAGRWYCTRLVSGDSTKCNQGYIEFNLTKGLVPNALACHETGHSVGLGHSTETDSCMQAAVASVDNNYNTHDRSHINGYLGY